MLGAGDGPNVTKLVKAGAHRNVGPSFFVTF